MNAIDAIVIGAGPAGLASAAALKGQGLNAVILEKADAVASVWRRHYDRLRLHTDRGHSGLPGMAMPMSYGRYPSRGQFVDYVESYAAKFGLKPIFGANVSTVQRDNGQWRAEAGANTQSAPLVVLATGLANYPYSPEWPGQESFLGSILHSSAYRNPQPYLGKKVLVVGFGNSGGEIALDLAEEMVDATLSVRGPVRILPRDLFGVPIVTWAIAQSHFPAKLTDAINAPVIRLAVGSIEKLGMKRAAKGPRQMVEEDGRVPLLDVGTVAKIRSGDIKVRGDIDRLTPYGVVFTETGLKETRAEKFDAIILATGFKQDLRGLLPGAQGVLDTLGRPLVSGRPTAEPGLFVCGALAVPTGQLREIGIEAARIARAAKTYVSSRVAVRP